MNGVRKEVIRCLEEHRDDSRRLITALDQVIRRNGKRACTTIFEVLASLNLSTVAAQTHWERLVVHMEEVSKSLGRSISLQTALVDYFSICDKTFRIPKIIEMKQYEKTALLSRYDKLTGLLNRHGFEEIFHQEISRAERHDKNLSILFFDLDDFKKTNDTYGHIAGDNALRKVAQIILEEKRDEDIAFRYGGEEMVVILPETDKESTFVVGERIRRRIEQLRLQHNSKSFNVTISGGLASFPYDATDASNLLDDADSALRRAKKIGKNKIALFSSDKRRYARCEFNVEILLKEVTFNGPNVDIVTGNNISIDGISVRSNHSYNLDSKVQLHIPFKNTSFPHLVVGKVKRVKPVNGGSLYDIGVTFMEVDQNTKNTILEHLLEKTSTTM